MTGFLKSKAQRSLKTTTRMQSQQQVTSQPPKVKILKRKKINSVRRGRRVGHCLDSRWSMEDSAVIMSPIWKLSDKHLQPRGKCRWLRLLLFMVGVLKMHGLMDNCLWPCNNRWLRRLQMDEEPLNVKFLKETEETGNQVPRARLDKETERCSDNRTEDQILITTLDCLSQKLQPWMLEIDSEN